MPVTEEREAVGARAAAATGPPGANGLVLGRYRLGPLLGSGGFGTVHAARDERLGREVAVKVIPAGGPAPERVRREAMAVARLDHPAIVALFDAGEDARARYLVSELVRGRTLAELERDRALSDRDVLRVGLDLGDALAHAHERGVIHRDVKPQNVLVPDPEPGLDPRRAPARREAKLTDFGVAHLAGDEPLTRTGDVVGTLAYMAPEQASGEPADERVDLYALALVLYEALAGRNPVAAGTPAAVARRIGTVLPPLSRSRPDLPLDLTAALDRALLPDPDARGDLDLLLDELAAALPEVSDEGGVLEPHPLESPLAVLPAALGRRLGPLAAGALAAAALGGLLPAGAAPVHPALGGLAAAALVALLPRAGWAAAGLALVAALFLAPDPRPGAGAVVLALVLVTMLAARGARAALSLPAAAPALGLLGLAGAFPALAAAAPGLAARAALGALGAWWLVLGEAVLGPDLLLGHARETPPRADWEGGASLAAADVIAPAITSGAVLLALPWAVAAAVLPWVVRGRWLGADLLAAGGWATGLALATLALGEWLGERVSHPDPRGLAAGAMVGALVAVAWRHGGSGHTLTMDREGKIAPDASSARP